MNQHMTTIRMTAEEHTRLRDFAAQEGRTATDVLRSMIRNLDVKPTRQRRRATLTTVVQEHQS